MLRILKEKKTGPAPAQRPDPTRWALASLSLSILLPSLGTSIVNVALPTLVQTLSVSFPKAQWLVLAYLLASTSLVVCAGRLGDIVGRRSFLQLGISLFTLASLLCGVSSTYGFLLVARAVQGLGAAIMMALSLAFVGDTVPREKIGRAMGLLGTMSAIGTALGPSLGGVLIAWAGWRAIFFVNVPLALAAFLLARRYLPADQKRPGTNGREFDYAGTLLLAGTLGAYALAMTIGQGRFGAVNLGLLVASVFGTGAFIFTERRMKAPLIRLEMFRNSTLRASLATSSLVSSVLMATLVVGPFFLTRALGLDTAVVGIIMSIGPIVAALTGAPAGRLVDRFGADRMSQIGLFGIASGCGILAALPARFGFVGYLAGIVLITVHYALFQAANNTAAMQSIQSEQRGVTSGLLNLSRNLGLITGASFMGAVFAHGAGTRNITLAPAESIATGMRLTFLFGTVLILFALFSAFISAAFLSGGRISSPVKSLWRRTVPVTSRLP